MKTLYKLSSGICAIALAGCVAQGPEVIAEEVRLAPMPKPDVHVGDEWHGLKNGKQYVSTVIAVDGDEVTYRELDGCEYTISDTTHDWGFALSSDWRGCPSFDDGSQKITSVRGTIWPLQVGNQVTYDFEGTSLDGNSWKGMRTCSVEEAVRIRTVSGEHDAFKLACDTVDLVSNKIWSTRTSYISPTIASSVYHMRQYKRDNQTIEWEMMRIKRGESGSSP